MRRLTGICGAVLVTLPLLLLTRGSAQAAAISGPLRTYNISQVYAAGARYRAVTHPPEAGGS